MLFYIAVCYCVLSTELQVCLFWIELNLKRPNERDVNRKNLESVTL